jgi:hypothetical protein
MLPLFLTRWWARPYTIQGHHQERQTWEFVRMWKFLMMGVGVHVEKGMQHALSLWCQSCFWMVVMVVFDGDTVLVM